MTERDGVTPIDKARKQSDSARPLPYPECYSPRSPDGRHCSCWYEGSHPCCWCEGLDVA